MNKSLKVLSLTLLIGSVLYAEEAIKEVAAPIEKYDTAEAIEDFIVSTFKATVDKASDASDKAKQLTKDTIVAIAKKVQEAAESDKKAYIEKNIKMLVADCANDKEDAEKTA